MSEIPNFDRRPARHVVIERIATGRWIERARFAEITDAGDYALSRRMHYEEVFASMGFETMVVTEPAPDLAHSNEAITSDEPGDGRVAGASPPFDS